MVAEGARSGPRRARCVPAQLGPTGTDRLARELPCGPKAKARAHGAVWPFRPTKGVARAETLGRIHQTYRSRLRARSNNAHAAVTLVARLRASMPAG